MTAFRIIASVLSIIGLGVGFVMIILRLNAIEHKIDELRHREDK